MKTLLLIVTSVLLCLWSPRLQGQVLHGRQADFYLNGHLIPFERLSLIHPDNIKATKIVKDIDPPRVYIKAKSITFLSYAEILKKARAVDSQNIIIMVDTEQYSKDLLIDKKLIKKVEFIKAATDTILIKTEFYEKRVEEAKHPSIRIRGAQS